MAFMIPEYSADVFVIVEVDSHTETFIDMFPASQFFSCDAYNLSDRVILSYAKLQYSNFDEDDYEIEIVRNKFFVRLSAPGYLDCTDWYGPFDSLEKSMEYLSVEFDIDPDSGDPLGME